MGWETTIYCVLTVAQRMPVAVEVYGLRPWLEDVTVADYSDPASVLELHVKDCLAGAQA